LYHRVETCFPILQKNIKERVLQELALMLEDTLQSWILQSNGEYQLQLEDLEAATSKELELDEGEEAPRRQKVQQLLLDRLSH
jgi:polyphosphate kinase